MKRRDFLKAMAGAGAALAGAKLVGKTGGRSALAAGPGRDEARGLHRLFRTDLPGSEWARFRADGLREPVCGVIYRLAQPATCGMPIGALDTGCIDLETSGLLGFCTIFNSHVPRRGPLNLPFLGLSVGRDTWVLCDPAQTKPYFHLTSGQSHPAIESICKSVGCWGGWQHLEVGTTNPAFPTPPLRLEGVRTPSEIHYWGHYPIADLEYETDSPVSVGLRTWAPFLPGDLVDSMIPGAVFEVHLRDQRSAISGQQSAGRGGSPSLPLRGTIAFSFPGPTKAEAGSELLRRYRIRGGFTGTVVAGPEASYALGVIGRERVRWGGELGPDAALWSRIAQSLPAERGNEPGASVAVDFDLAPGQSKVVRFVLAWHSPRWRAGGHPAASDTNVFTHMYAKHYPSAEGTARLLAREHKALLSRVLAWQEVLNSEQALPPRLQDVLVNNFHLITEVCCWAQAKPPIGDWCRPEDGLWAQNECPRGCPQFECSGNTYYGGMAVQYFFPQLVLSSIRGYKAYQYPDGGEAWIFGGVTGKTPPYELTMPTRGYQVGQTGSWRVGIVARHWMLTGDDEFLREVYPYVKKATEYTLNVNPKRPYGLISLPEFDLQESFESTPFKGMSSHVGIIRLYHLKMAERMAQRVGDTEFGRQCREWYDQSLELLEEYLWTGSYYLQHTDPETGETANVVMGYQLDGEFMALFDGLGEGVLPPDRVRIALDTLKRVGMLEWGPRVWSNPDGGPPDFDTGTGRPTGSMPLAP